MSSHFRNQTFYCKGLPFLILINGRLMFNCSLNNLFRPKKTRKEPAFISLRPIVSGLQIGGLSGTLGSMLYQESFV